MYKAFCIFIMMFTILSCASSGSIVSKNYDKIWINKVKGRSVVAPNGYLYTFLNNGDVEYSLFGKKRGIGKFAYAPTETNAYYYEVLPLKRVVRDVKTLSPIPNKKVNMYVSFILRDKNIAMTSDYKREYYNRLNIWNKKNLDVYGFLREDKDISEYPIPIPDEVELNKTIEFGTLRQIRK